jgi:RNA polymerase sigma factor (sigma-70 family)
VPRMASDPSSNAPGTPETPQVPPDAPQNGTDTADPNAAAAAIPDGDPNADPNGSSTASGPDAADAAASAAAGPSDADLIASVRAGDNAAYDALFARHAPAARRTARVWGRQQADVDDLVAESFTRVLQALRRGNGPTDAFRPYLLKVMRRVAVDWSADERKERLVPEPALYEPVPDPDDPAVAALDRTLAAQAFESLPERWQLVLWHTEVEGEKPSQVAPLLGVDAAAVSALAYRARAGLREAYLQAHLSRVNKSCEPYAQHYAEYLRGSIARRNRQRVDSHLSNCTDCHHAFLELRTMNAHIGSIVGPAVIGAAAATRLMLYFIKGAGAGSWLSRVPKRTQQATAVAAVVALLLAGIAFALAGDKSPAKRHLPPPTRAAAAPAPPSKAKAAPPKPPATSPPKPQPAASPPPAAPPPVVPSQPRPTTQPTTPPAPATTPAPPPTTPPPTSPPAPPPPPPTSPPPTTPPPRGPCPELRDAWLVRITVEIDLFGPPYSCPGGPVQPGLRVRLLIGLLGLPTP